MKAQATNNERVNVVIISRSTWEDPLTDMENAWGYAYDLLFPDTNELGWVKEYHEGKTLEEKHPDWNIIKINDEYRKQYARIEQENAINAAKASLERYQEELNEYNSKRLPQEKGQIVKVISGRKHIGKVGKITWFGNSKFDHSYSSKCYSWRAYAVNEMCKARPYNIPNKEYDLIRVVALDGEFEPFYINPAQCKVIEGYKDVVVTLENVLRFNGYVDKCSDAVCGYYDSVKY